MTSPIRNSVAASAATVVLVGLAAVASTPAGGTVYDGSGGPGVRADVGMAGDEIKQSEICGMRTRPRPFTRTASPSRLASST